MSTADRLAAALALALYDAHPIYPSTTGWRGDVGEATITTGCSFIDPPPEHAWTQYDLLSTPLREWIAEHSEFDLRAAEDALREELLARLEGEGL